MQENKKVLLIGLDAAEWSIINPLMEKGMLPVIQKLVNNGTCGKIKTLNPPFSPMLWTSIATGKTADKHGILGFVEPTGDNGIRPITSTSRKTRALWNILSGNSMKSNIIGWWPSHPCEPINGVMISNRFQKIKGGKKDEWPLAEDSFHGVSETEQKELAALRVHPDDIAVEDVRVFVPELEKVDQDKDRRLGLIQLWVAEAMTIRNEALWSMRKKDWNLTAIYFNELDLFSHDFMKFHPPHRPGIPENIYELYKNVMVAVYTMYDAIIGQLIAAAGEDCYVVLCSDHGFYSDDNRKAKIPDFAAGIALEHNPYGVFFVTGPDIRKQHTIYDAGLLDIAPTVLTMLNLPVGKDMDGRVLEEIFHSPRKINSIESWDFVNGNFGEHDKEKLRDVFSEQEALNQLVELGYVQRPEESQEEQIKRCLNETRYNLSVVLWDKGKFQEAVDILESLYEEDLVDVRYNLDLIKYHRKLNNTTRAREVLSNFKKFDISNLVNFDYLEGKIYYQEKNNKEALQCFRAALAKSPNYSDLLLSIGVLYNKMRQFDKAEEIFKRLLSSNPKHYHALHGLTISYNRRKKYDEAIDSALETLKLENSFAPAYYHLGEAFFHTDNFEAAAQALELSLSISPGISRSRNILLTIYKHYLPDQNKYNEHYKIYQESRKGQIVVVSGLPRSGTSMMMQMLKAGGLEILSDDAVKADESNPNGYYEYAPVKNSKIDNSWTEKAEGKVVKVIAQLLPTLGMKHKLKVIFMERNINEVVLSQNKMIALKSGKKGITFDMKLADTFTHQVNEVKSWIEKQNYIDVHYVNYRDVIENADDALHEINEFFDWQLEERAMKNCILPDLYHIRN